MASLGGLMFREAVSPERPLTIYALSDASGQTAEMVAKAAASQFYGQPARVVRLPRLTTVEQARKAVEDAKALPSLLAYTIVEPAIRQALEEEAQRYAVPCVDLLSEAIQGIADRLGVAPKYEPGAMHLKDEEYFKRMEAIDFAIKYDDGKSPSGLKQAELILVGVSRTSKTPTCMYLAQNQGIKTANVPLVPQADPPAILFDLPPGRIVGLTLSPMVLGEIRTSRLASLGLPPEAGYANRGHISDELEKADQVFRRLRCPVVDVTHKAVEETASEIMDMLRSKEWGQ